MSLVIHDAEVNHLAEELRRLTKADTKTEAVRAALRAHLDQINRTGLLLQRVKRSQAMADSLGPSDPTVDMKAYMDEMWRDV